MHLPSDPFGLVPLPPFQPAVRRGESVFGAPVELVCLPERKTRRGAPSAERPPFLAHDAEHILAEEATWRGPTCALTPNRWPLGRRELLLWSLRPTRELELDLLETAFGLQERCDGAVLGNTIGAAASIPRAHLHVASEKLPFLAALPRERFAPDYLVGCTGVDVLRLAPPFPIAAVGIAGSAPARARAVRALLEACAAPAFNLIGQGDEAWVVPRVGPEIPTPHFPCALGAAELWGRWFFVEPAQLERARGEDLERAIAAVGYARRA